MEIEKRNRLLLVMMLMLIAPLLTQSAKAEEMSAEISIRVDGLTCPFCAYGLEKKLKRLDGAEKIHIDIEKGIVLIQVVEGEKVKEKDLKQAVEDAGFTAKDIIYGRPQK
ncbi:hypothetical protein MNBD_NITROSPIRAE01-2198 [hydrothermal vent metagenome]|uniref:HMA domain-containing protein n=1 Tax=hydrothermal vent metagenome TaxID=652676 RepID=A0A3B1CST0_9ZZZZ